MRLKFSKMDSMDRIFHIASIAVLCFSGMVTAGEIRIGGTGNALGTIRLLGDTFSKTHPESKLTILSSIGTSGAIKAVPKGAIEIGLSSRKLTDEEIRSGLDTIEYARSPTVFAVRDNNKLTSITLNQVADIYTGKLASWPDGTAIRPILRQPGDDNTRQIKGLSSVIEKALAVAEQRPGLAFGVTDQEAADKMENIPGSFGVTTLALIRSEKRSLRPLALDGVEPTPENIDSGRYPMVKHFYFVLPKDPAPTAQAFVKFVKSAQGSEILKKTGHTIP